MEFVITTTIHAGIAMRVFVNMGEMNFCLAYQKLGCVGGILLGVLWHHFVPVYSLLFWRAGACLAKGRQDWWALNGLDKVLRGTGRKKLIWIV